LEVAIHKPNPSRKFLLEYRQFLFSNKCKSVLLDIWQLLFIIFQKWWLVSKK